MSKFRFLIYPLIVITLGALGAGLAYLLGNGVEPQYVSEALVGVSQVGGIVSGFSLTATAVLSLGGNYRKRVLEPNGDLVKFLLLSSFATVTLAAVVCAIAPVWKHQQWLILVLGAAVSVILASLISTLVVFNGAYSWNSAKASVSTNKVAGPSA